MNEKSGWGLFSKRWMSEQNENGADTHIHLPSNNTKWLSDILFNRNLFIHCSDIWKFVVEPLTWIGTAINEYYNISAFCFALALVLLDFSGSLNIFASITYEISYTHTHTRCSHKIWKDHIMATILYIATCMERRNWTNKQITGTQ